MYHFQICCILTSHEYPRKILLAADQIATSTCCGCMAERYRDDLILDPRDFKVGNCKSGLQRVAKVMITSVHGPTPFMIQSFGVHPLIPMKFHEIPISRLAQPRRFASRRSCWRSGPRSASQVSNTRLPVAAGDCRRGEIKQTDGNCGYLWKTTGLK